MLAAQRAMGRPCLAGAGTQAHPAFWTGLRVWPKDAYPIYDRIPGHENAFVFAMHSAVSLAAILEQALPDYVMGKPLPPDGAIFGLSRFAGGGSGFQGSAASSPHAEAPNK